MLTSDIRIPDAPGEEEGESVERSLRLYWRDHRLLSPRPRARLAIERWNLRRLQARLEATRPDVVSVWHMGALSFGLLDLLIRSEVPLVYVVCDDWLVYGPRIDAWSRLFAERPRLAAVASTLLRVPTALPELGRSGVFCFVSECVRRQAERESRWSFPRSTVVPSGIDLADFPIDRGARGQPWRWRLLYVGRMDDRKGVHTLVDAVALLPPQAHLDIIGRGDEEYVSSLRTRIERRGLQERVRFDVRPRHALREAYRAADVLVFPSEWDEPFGLVPLEAMACGTPVVATRAGGSAEFLTDGENCVAFPAGDAAALAAAVQRLAGDEALRDRLRVGGLDTAGVFTVERYARDLERIHRQAAGAGGPVAAGAGV